MDLIQCKTVENGWIFQLKSIKRDYSQLEVFHPFSGKHFSIARLLVEAGCDVQEADLEGTSPLHGAVMVGSLEAVQMLVEAGASREARDKFNRTPAGLAKEFGFVDLLNYLQTFQ